VYRIEIDRSLCSGFGSCAELAPRNLKLADDGLADVTDPRTDDAAIVGAAACGPVGRVSEIDQPGPGARSSDDSGL
jgi:ferredoxin